MTSFYFEARFCQEHVSMWKQITLWLQFHRVFKCSCVIWARLWLQCRISGRPAKLWPTDRKSWSWRLSSWRSNSATRLRKTSRRPAGNPHKQVRGGGQRSNSRVTEGSQSHSGVCCFMLDEALPSRLSCDCEFKTFEWLITDVALAFSWVNFFSD